MSNLSGTRIISSSTAVAKEPPPTDPLRKGEDDDQEAVAIDTMIADVKALEAEFEVWRKEERLKLQAELSAWKQEQDALWEKAREEWKQQQLSELRHTVATESSSAIGGSSSSDASGVAWQQEKAELTNKLEAEQRKVAKLQAALSALSAQFQSTISDALNA
eukprot:TRINITY_DN2866_c0_g1_i2.p2 TRINITY_DN2866_c0_g1~~TRINITY_DN2866_c0_g1_i2.p2  ORF type:complete len:162 (-),score=55.35 TRINITY_DN2866_c0_g1_i2:33-518(-)